MRSRRQAPVYDITGTSILTWKPLSFIEPLVESGDILYFCRECKTKRVRQRLCNGEAKPHAMIYRATEHLFTEESRTSITMGEMNANVGLGSRKAIRAARLKIKYWQREGDHKNPLPTNFCVRAQATPNQRRLPVFRRRNLTTPVCSLAIPDAVRFARSGHTRFINRSTAIQLTSDTALNRIRVAAC